MCPKKNKILPPSELAYRKMLSIEEAASLLHVGHVTLREIVKNGFIGTMRNGSNTLIPMSSLDLFIEQQIGSDLQVLAKFWEDAE